MMQFVTFTLEDKMFAISVDAVQGIFDRVEYTRVPKSPKFIKGLINLRGSIMTLVDINLLLNIEEINIKENIIMISVDNESIGIEVDLVKEVINIEKESITTICDSSKRYIIGLVDYNEASITIIDVNKLISINEEDKNKPC